MKTWIEKSLLSLTALFLIITPMQAQEESITWQKINFETNLKNQVSESIKAILPSQKFVVHVKSNLKSVTAEVKAGGGAAGGGGKDTKPEEPTKAKKIRLEDPTKKEVDEDYIVFEKLGLEAPVYEEKEEPAAPAKPAAAPGATPQSSGGDDKKEKPIEFISLIDGIKIDVYLDEQLANESKTAVQNMLNKMDFSFGELKPNLEVHFIPMQEEFLPVKKTPEVKPLTAEDILLWLSRFNNTIALVSAMAIFFILSMMLFKKYEKLHAQYLEALKNQSGQAPAAQADEEEEEDEDEKSDSSALENPMGNLGAVVNPDLGFDKFKVFLSKSPAEASILVKKFLKENTEKSKMALNGIVAELDQNQLRDLFSNLSLEDRQDWKKILKGQLSATDRMSASQFLANEIAQDLIVPPVFLDPEIQETLLEITPDQAASFCQKYPDSGSILMNIMSTKFINQMMEKLPNDTYVDIVGKSLHFSNKDALEIQDDFKTQLSEFKQIKTRNPFAQKLVDLIPLSNPEKEFTLFQALLEAEGAETVVKMAQNYFPATLMDWVSDEHTKFFLESVSLDKRAELLVSLDADKAQTYTNLIAAPGSKARDMLDMAIEKITDDAKEVEKIKGNADQIWKNFIMQSRKSIRQNFQVKEELKPVIERWTQHDLPKKTKNLKLAA